MNIDIFDDGTFESAKERAGGILAKKDLNEERHEKKQTDEDVYLDFLHNVRHPFMYILRKEAEKYAKSGKAFVCWRRINALIDEEDSEARLLYYNDGAAWRQSGNALVWKYLKELYPNLYTPGMRFGCKGEKLLLENNPGKFEWVREVLKKRAERDKEEEA